MHLPKNAWARADKHAIAKRPGPPRRSINFVPVPPRCLLTVRLDDPHTSVNTAQSVAIKRICQVMEPDTVCYH